MLLKLSSIYSSPRIFWSTAIVSVFGWCCVYLATDVFRDYAVGLFLWLPFVMGLVFTLILTYKNLHVWQECRNLSFLALTIMSFGLLAFAFEGIICLIMAAPIALLCNWIGAKVGYAITENSKPLSHPVSVILIMATVPALMSVDHIRSNETEPLRSVITSVEINAPIETVWKNVVQFPQLPPPKEFIFKTGIAYPINATIKGNNVGAIRNCNFSTGSFVEPITEWKEPELLGFDVLDQPEPMKELSFYDLHPNHLHGFFVSKRGQFHLTKLPNGHTLLEGTTWYLNKIKPGFYWTIWSDYIVHQIHQRVLNHIKAQSERS